MAKLQLPKGIRQRGDKFFVDVTHNGQRKTATCDTLEAAIAQRALLSEAMQTGRDIKQVRANAVVWTLQQALDKTLSLPKPEGWRGCSYERQATLNVQDAIDFMGGERKLDTIGRALTDAWLHQCEVARGNSDSTINRKISALSKVMKVAVEFGGLGEMPKMPKLRKEPVGRIRQISRDEETQLLHLFRQLGNDDHAEAVTVLIDTGVRCSELWNVRPEDVDLKGGVMMVYGTEGKGTKNGSYRSVPMTARVKEIMERRCKAGSPFPFDNVWIRHPWDRVRGLMGLAEDKDFSPHVCRHTCASRLVKAGVSLPVVQRWLGHSDIKTTMKYVHLMPTDLMQAAAAMERMAAE